MLERRWGSEAGMEEREIVNDGEGGKEVLPLGRQSGGKEKKGGMAWVAAKEEPESRAGDGVSK